MLYYFKSIVYIILPYTDIPTYKSDQPNIKSERFAMDKFHRKQ